MDKLDKTALTEEMVGKIRQLQRENYAKGFADGVDAVRKAIVSLKLFGVANGDNVDYLNIMLEMTLLLREEVVSYASELNAPKDNLSSETNSRDADQKLH